MVGIRTRFERKIDTKKKIENLAFFPLYPPPSPYPRTLVHYDRLGRQLLNYFTSIASRRVLDARRRLHPFRPFPVAQVKFSRSRSATPENAVYSRELLRRSFISITYGTLAFRNFRIRFSCIVPQLS